MGMMSADCIVCDATGIVDKETWNREIEERRIPTEMIQPKFEVDYREQDRLAFKSKMHNANVAYLNQPISLNKQIQNSPAHERLTEAEINKLKAQVKPREDDMLAAQREVIASEDAPVEAEEVPATVETTVKTKAKKSGTK